MRHKMKTVCQVLAALAIAVAPGAAQNCRIIFFEEKAPENLDALMKKHSN